MNQLLLYAGLAVARPVLSYLLRRITGAGDPRSDGRIPFFEPLHQLPGRVRYHSELLREPDFALMFGDKLRTIPGVLSACINQTTGSVLVTFDERQVSVSGIFRQINQDLAAANRKPPLLLADSTSGSSVPSVSSAPRQGRGQSGQGAGSASWGSAGAALGKNGFQASSLRETFFERFSQISGCISRRTGGYFDLPSLLGMILMARGAYKMVKLGQMPSGPQLVWWGLNFFRLRGKNGAVLPYSPANSR